MRILPNGFQEHLESGATTLCWCWKVVRRDGVALGFTDHDRDLTFDGLTFEAASGFTSSDTRQAVGLGVDNSDIEGALQSGRIVDAHLANGVYESARVELLRVNWTALDQRVLMRVATIGEVTRDGHGFRAELRGLTHMLGQTQGRIYQRSCDVDLGEPRCGVDLGASVYRSTAHVATVISPSQVVASGFESFSSGWFSFGSLQWTSGENLGRGYQIKAHANDDDGHRLTLWEPMRGEIKVGDAFDITAGCDKRFATCAEKFDNTINFQGFPHLPGADYVTFYPNSDDPR